MRRALFDSGGVARSWPKAQEEQSPIPRLLVRCYSARCWLRRERPHSSERSRVAERYKLSNDGLRLDYSHTLVDPEFLTEPVVESFGYEKIDDREYLYETCDVESASRPLQYAGPVL